MTKAKTINIVSKTQKIKKVVIEVFYFIWYFNIM